MIQKASDLWVITVNWNKPYLTEKCVKSLTDNNAIKFTSLVIDNGSIDDSVIYLHRALPFVQIIETGKNLGFAGGYNVGINSAIKSGAKYIYIINNDTISCDNLLHKLLESAFSLDADICAPVIFYASKPDKVWSAGGNFCPILLSPLDAHNRNSSIPDAPIRRDFFSGCALLIKSEVFKKIGLFDDQFFLYYEDLDFFIRAKNSGIRAWLIPSAKVIHLVSASSSGLNSKQERYWMACSSGRYYKKHVHGWRWFFILPWRITHTIYKCANLLLTGKVEALHGFINGILCGIKNENMKA